MATLNICEKFGKTIETHEISGSFREFLYSDVDGYDSAQPLPFTVEMNGEPLDLDRQLIKGDVVNVTVEPQVPAIPYVIAIVAAAYSYYVASNIDKPDLQNLQRSTTATGNSIYSANARANDLAPSGIVRSQSGRINTYPKYIIPPYSRFVDNKEIRYYMLSVGEGFYNYSQDNVYLAETPINRYNGDFKLDIYEPSDDVTGSDSAEFWLTSKDVSGVRLTTDSELQYGTYTIDVSGDQITTYFNGVAAPFPFADEEAFRISSGFTTGPVRVKSISGLAGETATVVTLEKSLQDAAIGSLYLNLNTPTGYKPPLSDPNSWEDSAAPNYTPATGIAVDFEGYKGGVNWEGPFVITPDGELSEYFEIDFKFVQGLAERNSEGDLVNRTVVVQLAWREYGTNQWNFEPQYSWTNNVLDELGFTKRVFCGRPIRQEIQFRRVTPEAKNNNIYDVVDVVGVKTRLDVQNRYNDISTMALEVIGSEGLASTATQQINIRNLVRKLPTLAEIQALSWDLRSEVTKAPDFWSFVFNRYRSAWNTNKTVDGVDLSYSNPSIDYNRAGNQMAVVVGGKWARIYYTSNFSCFPVDVRSSFIDVPLTQDSIDTVLRFGNDTHDKYVYIRAGDRVQIISTIDKSLVSELVSGYTGVQDVYSKGNGLVFYHLLANQVVELTMTTPWDLSTLSGATTPFVIATNDAKSMYFGNGGLKWHLLRAGVVEEYTLTTAYDLTTATLDATITDFSTNNPLFIVSSPDSFIFSEKEGDETAINQYYRQTDIDTRETRSIARFCAYSLWQVLGDNVVSQVDWAALSALETLWESREDYFDAEIADETTLWEVLKLALSAGYSEPTLAGGLFTPVRVSAGTDYDQLYTPDIMTSELQFDQNMFDGSENDGLEIEYYDAEAAITNTVLCLSASDSGQRPSRAQAIGVTDRNKAWRYGMRQRNRDRYKPGTISFSTELDALNSNYGRPVEIAHDMFLSQYGEVVNYLAGTLVLTLSFVPVFTAAQSHFIALRDLDGKVEFLSCSEISGNEIQLSTGPTFTPVFDADTESTLVSFGTEAEITKRGIVRNVQIESETEARLVIEEYKESVYLDDDSNVGGQPYILDGQVFNYNEFRPAGGFVGYIKSGSGYWPSPYDIVFDNGTKTSDDGFFELGVAPNISKLTMTAAGAANSARNNFDTLPNTFFYNVKTTYVGGESEVQDITLKVKDTAFPPVGTLAYWPMESLQPIPSTSEAWINDYINKSYSLFGTSPELRDESGLKNYGYSVRLDNYAIENSVADGQLFPQDFLEQETGTYWIAVKNNTFANSWGFSLDIHNDDNAGGRSEVSFKFNRIANTSFSVNIDASVYFPTLKTYTANSFPAISPDDYLLIGIVGAGSEYKVYLSGGPGFITITDQTDTGAKGYWNAQTYSEPLPFKKIRIDNVTGLNSPVEIVSSGYTSSQMTEQDLDKLAEYVLAVDPQ